MHDETYTFYNNFPKNKECEERPNKIYCTMNLLYYLK